MIRRIIRLIPTLNAVMEDLKYGLRDDECAMFDARIANARNAVSAYRRTGTLNRCDAVCNLLCDLMYLCEREPHYGDFEEATDWAKAEFEQGL